MFYIGVAWSFLTGLWSEWSHVFFSCMCIESSWLGLFRTQGNWSFLGCIQRWIWPFWNIYYSYNQLHCSRQWEAFSNIFSKGRNKVRPFLLQRWWEMNSAFQNVIVHLRGALLRLALWFCQTDLPIFKVPHNARNFTGYLYRDLSSPVYECRSPVQLHIKPMGQGRILPPLQSFTEGLTQEDMKSSF